MLILNPLRLFLLAGCGIIGVELIRCLLRELSPCITTESVVRLFPWVYRLLFTAFIAKKLAADMEALTWALAQLNSLLP